MSQERIDELLAKLCDEGLTSAEVDEIEERLGNAEAATWARARNFLRLEAGLRRAQRGGDVSVHVMATLADRETSRVSRVMQDVERRTAGVKAAWLTRRPPARPGWRRRVGVGAMLLVAGSAFALMWRLSRAPSGVPVAVPTETRVMPPMPPLRLLTPSPTDLAPGTPGVSTGETSELFVFDFENGATPAALRSGAVVPGPPRPGNGFVAIGGLSEWEPQANIIQIEFSDIDRRLHFSDRIVVTFDVWAGGEVGRLTVQSYNEARRHNFHLGFSQIARGRWLHVTVRLADLVANDPSKVVAIPGDVLNNFLIIGGRLPGGGLYVDNIRVVEFRQGAALPPTRVEDAN